MKHRKPYKRLSMPEISLTPLVDTALTLLVIFMVAAPMMHYTIKVDLPKGSSTDIKKQSSQVVVSVFPNGVIKINEKEIEQGHLIAEVKEALKVDPQARVYLYGDTAASYGSIIEIFDALKNAAISSVVLAIRPL
jgi:biopolymer transport protein ExbD